MCAQCRLLDGLYGTEWHISIAEQKLYSEESVSFEEDFKRMI